MKGREWYQADEIAREYDQKRFSRGGRLVDRREKRAVLDGVEPIEDREVLEVACGTGRFTAMLAERGAEITGLDISAEMLAQGREKATKAGVDDRIEFVRGDAGGLPFPDDSFDIVFAMRFFHLADTPVAYLEEMNRVARETVFFDTFNDASARVLYNWLLPMGSRLYGRTEMQEIVSEAGLSLERTEHDFVFPYGFYRQIPNQVADGFRTIDRAVGDGPGERLTSVTYWHAAVDDGEALSGEQSTAADDTVGSAGAPPESEPV